jgi:ribonuclease HI
MYSIQCIRDWAAGWEKNGWKKKTGEIKNLEIIKQAYVLYNEIKEAVLLSHVKAHAGTEGNELADRMTMIAVDRKDLDWVQYEKNADDKFDIPALLKMRAG